MLQAAAEHYGIDSPLIPKIATGFCGGVMVLGLAFGRTSADVAAEDAYENVQEFLRIFQEQYGSINCFELTGCDLGDAEDLKMFRTTGIKERCREYTGTAARLAAEIIESKG